MGNKTTSKNRINSHHNQQHVSSSKAAGKLIVCTQSNVRMVCWLIAFQRGIATTTNPPTGSRLLVLSSTSHRWSCEYAANDPCVLTSHVDCLCVCVVCARCDSAFLRCRIEFCISPRSRVFCHAPRQPTTHTANIRGCQVRANSLPASRSQQQQKQHRIYHQMLPI